MRYVYLVRVEGDSEVEEGNVRRDGSRRARSLWLKRTIFRSNEA
jgi:hypothetical protein